MTKVLCRFLFLSSLISLSARAQEMVPLKLEEATQAALKNNGEVALATLEQESSITRFGQTNAVFLPQVNLSYTALTSNNPLNAFGFKLQQQSIAATDFDPRLLNSPSATQNFIAKAEIYQPLLNMDMIYARQAAQEQTNLYSFKTKRTKEYVSFEVSKAYEQLRLAQEAVKVLEGALLTIRSIYHSANHRFEKGFLQKSDVLQVQVQVEATESKLAEAKSNVHNASDYLALLMGEKMGKIFLVDSIGKRSIAELNEWTLPDDRADFKAMKAALNAQEKMIYSGRMAYLPKLNAFGNFLINDKTAFGFGSSSYLLGAQFTWSVFSGTATRNKVAEYRVERNKVERQLDNLKEQSQLELNKTERQLRDAEFLITQSETAERQAEESLRILKNRFEQGLVSTNELLQAQTLLAQQKLMRAQALFQYNTTLSYLQFLTTSSSK